MENRLLKKLRIGLGNEVLIVNAPANLSSIFNTATAEVNFNFATAKKVDVLLIFAITKAQMLSALNSQIQHINIQIICWILYPKAKSKLAADLNLMQSWDDLNTYNLTPCASAAINEDWTALRIKPIDAVKKSGRANKDIITNEFGNYIDVKNKIITLPEDMQAMLQSEPKAMAFFEQLSYTNRKEYVLWILTAKQEKTRADRLIKTVVKLLEKRKNP